MRNSSDVSVNVEFLNKENAFEAVEKFCNLNVFESSSVDNELIGIEKRIRQNHRTFSAGGIFRNALNRHEDFIEKCVERNLSKEKRIISSQNS